MIGSGYVTIDAADFVKGICTTPEIPDGGFSPETSQVNLIAQKGVLNAPGAITNRSTSLSDEIIASCEDPTYVGKDRVFLDDSGNFYTYTSNTLTKEATASGDLFTLGTTDFVPWYDATNNLKFYATTKAGAGGDIVRWDKGATLVEDWWTNAAHRNQAALSALTAWRPLLVFETNLYIGDANKLHRVTPALAASNGLLTLSFNEIISALGIDNTNGRMLIATTTSVDYSVSRNGKSKIYIYDGYSSKALKVCEVNGTITSFLSKGSNTYVFYGNKMGLFTGSGIQFLREFRFAIGTAVDAIYPHRRCVIDDTIYIAENYDVLGTSLAPTIVMAYGPVRDKGPDVFYPTLNPDTTNKKFTMLCPLGGNKLGFSFETSKLYDHDVTSIAAVISGGAPFLSRIYDFPRPMNIRAISIEYKTAITTGSDTIGTLSIIDDTGTTTTIKTIAQDSVSTQKKVVTPSTGVKTSYFQVKYLNSPGISTKVFGVKRIVVYYDFAE